MNKITKCRICGNEHLVEILNLGNQELTGVFPLPEEQVGGGELSLVKCVGEDSCGLVQLKYSFDVNKMYGKNYGYRSGLNRSMVDHLTSIVREIEEKYAPSDGDLVIDIGSNDGTTLSKYRNTRLDLLGMDPTGVKFQKYYPAYVELYPDFFQAENVRKLRGDKKAKVITSIAMFYDLESPISFAKDIEAILDDEGVWIFEQSYLPAMVDAVSYDTVCHEHLEFYCLKQIQYIVAAAGLKVIDVVQNDINGGSFRVTAARKNAHYEVAESVARMLAYEEKGRYGELDLYERFRERVEANRKALRDFLEQAKKEGKTVLGYGASTKGNVTLQYCGVTAGDIPVIADVNEDKYGHVTPATHIPIVSEEEAWSRHPDFFLVLPWHFREFILEKERENMKKTGCKFVFPFPELEIVGAED
ncbi:MAG: class I SAM-dependent methyltransferase [Lachnospiraceae bacterium]|nr:class I SAM-dependent methyltransferase [Lachnospiraceae bacterium]